MRTFTLCTPRRTLTVALARWRREWDGRCTSTWSRRGEPSSSTPAATSSNLVSDSSSASRRQASSCLGYGERGDAHDRRRVVRGLRPASSGAARLAAGPWIDEVVYLPNAANAILVGHELQLVPERLHRGLLHPVAPAVLGLLERRLPPAAPGGDASRHRRGRCSLLPRREQHCRHPHPDLPRPPPPRGLLLHASGAAVPGRLSAMARGRQHGECC